MPSYRIATQACVDAHLVAAGRVRLDHDRPAPKRLREAVSSLCRIEHEARKEVPGCYMYCVHAKQRVMRRVQVL